MLWRNQSGICPPFFYVIIAEKDKLKSLKDFFGLKMKNSVGPLVLQEQVHTVNCWINVKNLSLCFCFFCYPPKTCIDNTKKKLFCQLKVSELLLQQKNVWSLWKSCLSLKQESGSKYFIFCCELLKYECFALFEIKKSMEIRAWNFPFSSELKQSVTCLKMFIPTLCISTTIFNAKRRPQNIMV